MKDGIPVLIYLSEQEFTSINTLAQELFKNFKAQNQKYLKTNDIREFVKFATLAYYNMVVLKIREEAKLMQQKQQQQNQQNNQYGT